MKRCYIFHVIDTLTLEHITNALISLTAQKGMNRWDNFMLYNASHIPSDDIFRVAETLGIPNHFDFMGEFLADIDSKSVAADWGTIMQKIDGFDLYFLHKADFYLPPYTLDGVESNCGRYGPNWLVNYYKVDAKEWATDIDMMRLSLIRDVPHVMAAATTANYSDNDLSRAAFIVPPVRVGELWDGTMMAYNDAARSAYRLVESDRKEWGYTSPIKRMRDFGTRLVQEPTQYVIHMWHDVPQKKDTRKNITGDRF